MQETRGNEVAAADGPSQRGEGKRGFVVGADGPPDDAAREQVEPHRQVAPALGRRDVRDVAGRDLRRPGRDIERARGLATLLDVCYFVR